jgi:hypothetical protein
MSPMEADGAGREDAPNRSAFVPTGKFSSSRYIETFQELLRRDVSPTRPLKNLLFSDFTPTKYRPEAFELYGGPPRPPRRVRIKAFCSTLHVDSVLVLLWASHFLNGTGWDLEVIFDRTSSQALKRYDRCNRPALITVTEGTAKRIEAGGGGALLLEAPPGRLRWTSPHGAAGSALPDLRHTAFVVVDHPTDHAAFEEFYQALAGTLATEAGELQLSSTIITTVPEHVSQYVDRSRSADRFSRGATVYSLTNSFMDHWALGREPNALPGRAQGGWDKVERRFLYANAELLAQHGEGKSFASWLQHYLEFYLFLDKTHEIRKYFLQNIRQFERTYLYKGLAYLGVKHD